jgi:hypothetical protein
MALDKNEETTIYFIRREAKKQSNQSRQYYRPYYHNKAHELNTYESIKPRFH